MGRKIFQKMLTYSSPYQVITVHWLSARMYFKKIIQLVSCPWQTFFCFHIDCSLNLSEIGKKGTLPCITITVDAPFYNDPRPTDANLSHKNSSGDSKGSFMGLWDYEVVEAFFLSSETKQYLEVELGPHGHHLVLFLNGKKNIIKQCLPIKWEVSIGNKI